MVRGLRSGSWSNRGAGGLEKAIEGVIDLAVIDVRDHDVCVHWIHASRTNHYRWAGQPHFDAGKRPDRPGHGRSLHRIDRAVGD